MRLPAISRPEFLQRAAVLSAGLALPDTGLLAPGEVRTSGAHLTTFDYGDVTLNAYSPYLQPTCSPAT
jgi:hypothetical protein